MTTGLRYNPIILKELRARMRGARGFALLTGYLGALALLVVLVYAVFAAAEPLAGSANDQRDLGKAIFGIVVGMQFLLVSFIAPGLTAGAVSAERERQTFDLLRATLLPARALVLGKFTAALLFLLLLLFAALPLQSLAFLFGGVTLEEMLIGALLLAMTAVVFCALGLACSSYLARTLTSTVLAYGTAGLLVFGLPFLILVFSSLAGGVFSASGQQLSANTERLLVIGGWLLVSANPLSAAVASEYLLIDRQQIFTFTFPLSAGGTLWLLSPWVVYSLLNLLISAVLLWISIRRVGRGER